MTRPPGLQEDQGDAGLGLVELLVAMVIGSVVLVTLMAVFVSSLRTNRSTVARTGSTADARNALDAISLKLRVAADVATTPVTPAIVTASSTSIKFYANLTSPTAPAAEVVPTLVEYAIVGACLVERRTPGLLGAVTGSYSWPAAGMRETCLARGLVAGTTTGATPAAGPLFTYFTDGTTEIPIGTDASGSLASADLPTIDSVRVSLKVGPAVAVSAGAATAVSRVTLVNLIPETAR